MKPETRFLRDWILWVGRVTLIILAIAGFVFYNWYPNWCLFLSPLPIFIIAPIMRWSDRLEVPARCKVVAQRRGKLLKVIEPGMYFPFKYFGYFNNIKMYPINNQIFHIFSGERANLDPEVIEEYGWGSHINIVPGTGAPLRFQYDFEFRNDDVEKVAISHDNTYEYLVSIIEEKLNVYAQAHTSEEINDNFATKDWNKDFILAFQRDIFDNTGITILRFIPLRVLNTPKVEASKLSVEEEIRKGEVLKAELNNMGTKKEIAVIDNDIKTAAIDAIMKKTGVDGHTALNHVTELRKQDTLRYAAECGNVTYFEGKGKLNDASIKGWGWHDHNKGGAFTQPKKDSDGADDSKTSDDSNAKGGGRPSGDSQKKGKKNKN